MTATEELRRMLDERGAKWHTYFVDGAVHTTWNDAACWFTELEDGTTVWGEAMEGSPAQAIEATLGRGECQDKGDPGDFCCSECGVRMFTSTNDTYTMITSDGRTIIERPNYCPNCGRQVKR